MGHKVVSQLCVVPLAKRQHRCNIKNLSGILQSEKYRIKIPERRETPCPTDVVKEKFPARFLQRLVETVILNIWTALAVELHKNFHQMSKIMTGSSICVFAFILLTISLCGDVSGNDDHDADRCMAALTPDLNQCEDLKPQGHNTTTCPQHDVCKKHFTFR